MVILPRRGLKMIPFDPNNPDERNDLYIEVTVEVRPWVVRINDIEF